MPRLIVRQGSAKTEPFCDGLLTIGDLAINLLSKSGITQSDLTELKSTLICVPHVSSPSEVHSTGLK